MMKTVNAIKKRYKKADLYAQENIAVKLEWNRNKLAKTKKKRQTLQVTGSQVIWTK